MSLSYGFLIPNTAEDSHGFSEAIHALFSDGVTKYGGQYALTLGGSMKVDLATGCAMANGRYIKHDEPLSLVFPASGNTADRYDAVAAHVDYPNRKAEIVILVDIDPNSLPRDEMQYNVPLYVVRIRRGSSMLRTDDIQDARADAALCGYITPLSGISGDIEYVYGFTQSRIEEAVAGIIEKIQKISDNADRKIAALDKKITTIAGSKGIGDMEISRRPLSPENEWLLCDGTAVPKQYPKLSEMLGGTLPDISGMNDRYKSYIYGGMPVEV